MWKRTLRANDLAMVTVGQESYKYRIISIEPEIIYIDNQGGISALIPGDGKWVVQGFDIPHEVSFEAETIIPGNVEDTPSILPNDMLNQVLFKLKYDNIIRLCATSKTYTAYCNNDEFWRLRIAHDYPTAYRFTPGSTGFSSYKELYMKVFDHITIDVANMIARRGNIELLQWMATLDRPVLPTKKGAYMAAKNGRVEVLDWMYKRNPPIHGNGRKIEMLAASLGHINILEWIREGNLFYTSRGRQSVVSIGPLTASRAVSGGNIRVLKWLAHLNPPIYPTQRDIDLLLKHGIKLNILNWLEDHGILPTSRGADLAAENGHINVLEWLETRGILPTSRGANFAAGKGHINILEWLKNRNILPTEMGALEALIRKQHDVLAWLASLSPPIYPIEYIY
jgi:hypothetical protein